MDTIRLLIVDDEADFRQGTRKALERRGYEVREAGSGAEAIELVEEERPDVVLLDLMMPERGGLSTLVALRRDEELRSVPIVVVTGIDQEVHNIYGPDEHFDATMKRAKHFRPDAYVTKPIDPERLIEVLDELAPEILTQ